MSTFTAKSGNLLVRGVWHNFGGPCSYRVTPMRDQYSIRLDATGEVVRPGGQAGSDALMMAMYYERRAETYEEYAFGTAVIKLAEEYKAGDDILQKFLGDPK